jgi:serine/threonine protein kinase
MNEIEIDLMTRMLEMDPYQRIKAHEAIEHEYFDDLRAKDPEYGANESKSSIDGQLNGNDSDGQLFNKNKRILSPELLNSRGRVGGSTTNGTVPGNFNLTNKNSYSHASHHNGVEATRRSDNGYAPNSIVQAGGTS